MPNNTNNYKKLDTLFHEIQYDLPLELKKRLEAVPIGLEIQTTGYLFFIVLSLIPALLWLTFKNYSQILYGLTELLPWISSSLQMNISNTILLIIMNMGLALTMVFVLLNYYLDKKQQLPIYQNL